ncbi:MAG: hypothetical protein OXH64_03180, partial [Rhodospirillaceae bacterium]|nr:hypothetical protein [Rhodospirillaceae bacterium]
TAAPNATRAAMPRKMRGMTRRQSATYLALTSEPRPEKNSMLVISTVAEIVGFDSATRNLPIRPTSMVI